MKKITSILLVLTLLIACFPAALAEGASLTLPSAGISVVEKFKVDAAPRVSMSDGSALPSDLKYAIKSTKLASVNKKGMITSKKAGSATLTVSSKSLGQSATCTVSILPNVHTETRSVEELMRVFDEVGPDYHSLFAFDRKMYFKNGKLTVDLYFYNRFGYDIRKVYNLDLKICDRETDAVITRYRKATVRKKLLNNGESFKFTFSFPKKGLDKKLDLTRLGSNGFPAQIYIDGGFGFYHNAPDDDPWGYDD